MKNLKHQRNLFASATFLEMFTRRSRSGVAGSQKTAAAKPQSNKLPLLGKSLSLYSSLEESGFTTPSGRALSHEWMNENENLQLQSAGFVGKKPSCRFMNERVRLSATFNQLVGGFALCGEDGYMPCVTSQQQSIRFLGRSIKKQFRRFIFFVLAACV